jgi:predicted XRE-type DNA-binding protein
MSYTHSRREPARRPGRTSKPRGGASRRSSMSAGSAKPEYGPEDSRITLSSGNVFRDVGFPPEEALNLLIRTDLMIQIEQLIRRRKLTQAKAAKLFGVTQPRISDLVRGKIELFSIDALIMMLERAGAKVEVKVRAA